MLTRSLPWFVIALALLLGARAPAQVKFFHPEKFERKTKTDENGLIQWADHEKAKCPNCSGTGKMKCTTCARYPDEVKKCRDCGRDEKREAVCHACAGTGHFLDPLEQALCPGCQGAGAILCGCCPGTGVIKAGSDRLTDCIGCRGEGWFECPICKGKRTVGVAKLKPSLAEASAKDLKKALETTDETLTAMSEFRPIAKNTRKEIKELQKAIKTGEKVLPALKDMPKLIKQLMKWTYAGSNYQGQAERELNSMERVKHPVEFYLKHQKRMLELALARAEANEKKLAEQDGK